jgi:hypothetical protein
VQAAQDKTAQLLGDAVVERQRAEDLNRDLLEALSVKDEFLGLMSHEFRSPMTTIHSGLAALGKFVPLGTNEGELVKLMQTDAERLRSMIEDLLTLARLGAQDQGPREPVLVQRTARHVIDWFKTRTSRRGPVILLAPEDAAPVAGSESYVERVIENLLGNADKYSPPDKPIVVEITESPNEVRVSVIDDGPGVAPGEINLIFERFFRSGRTSGLASGTGLGLAVCRRLVDSMGGRIWADSPPGKGLAVSFALGVVEAPQPIAAAAGTSTGGG